MSESDAAVSPSPIPALTPEAEASRLKRALASSPASILCVSDLHLGPGLDPVTGRYDRRENFFAAEAFAAFLDAHAPDRDGAEWLVLNGDILDFLRIVAVPRSEADLAAWAAELARLGAGKTVEELRAAIDPHERRYGLQTDDYKCVYKLRRVAEGHPGFFDALASWIACGGTIVYVKGNHDVEQHWPLVRRALRDEIQRRGAEPGAVTDRFLFADGPTQLGNLRFEHGHDHEWLTAVAGPPVLERPAGQLRLPLGSFVNRYIINKLEGVDPFLDNVKPVDAALKEIVKSAPLKIFRIGWQGAILLVRSVRKARGRPLLLVGLLLGAFLLYAVPVATVAAIVGAIVSPGFREWLLALPGLGTVWGQGIIGTLFTLLPFLVNVVRNLVGRQRLEHAEDEFSEKAFESARRAFEGFDPGAWDTFHIVLGHTHRQDVQELPSLGSGHRRTLYVNTGTWAPLWRKERPDLIGRVLHTYALFDLENGEYRVRSLQWEPDARDGRRRQLPVMLTAAR